MISIHKRKEGDPLFERTANCFRCGNKAVNPRKDSGGDSVIVCGDCLKKKRRKELKLKKRGNSANWFKSSSQSE